MRTLFSGDLHVSYSQFYVMGENWSSEDMDACFAGQVNGLCGAGVPGGLWLRTGLHTGLVAVAVERHDTAPPLGDDWEEIVEVSFDTVPSLMLFNGSAAHHDVEGWGSGPHRVRYCAVRMDEGRAADVRFEDEPEIDRYLLQLWPAAPAPDAVLRQTSEIAAYWHGTARSGPSAAEVAARRRARDAERRERRRIERERPEAQRREWYDLQVWGGPRPADPLGSVHVAAPVAKLDLALAEELVRLRPGADRAMARWAARAALAEAGLDRIDWIVAAADALDAEAALPPPFDQPHEVTRRLFTDPRVEHRVVTTPDGVTDNLSQQAMGVYALITAAQDDPATALFSAVQHAQLTFGRDRLPVLHAALRDRLRTL